MKKILVLVAIMMLYQATGVSQACEETPIIASAAYTFSSRPVFQGNAVQGNAVAASDGGIEFVHVTGGCYCMGAADGSRDTTPAHQVCVDDYYMGKYEVTQAQWTEIMGNNPSTMSSCGDNCPVVDVSWNEAQEFARRLSERTGKIYRLPTEAEWEYAVRIGEMQAKNSAAPSAPSNGARTLRPVGWSEPNGIGIYDMQGSVWEWTGDRYSADYYKTSPTNNPEGPAEGRYRALRGGSWDDTQNSIHPTLRAKYEPWLKRPWVGFRLTSSDQYSAKYRDSGILAAKAGQGLQCGLVQQAASNNNKTKLSQTSQQ